MNTNFWARSPGSRVDRFWWNFHRKCFSWHVTNLGGKTREFPKSHFYPLFGPTLMRSRDIFGRRRLRLRLRLRGSIPAPAPAPSKTVRRLRLRLRLRAKCTGSGAPAPAPAPMIESSHEPKPAIRFSKMPNVKIWLLTDLAVSLNAICHSLSSKAVGWYRRGHRLLRVALCEISGLGPKKSFATDTQRILNIRRRISPRWRFWSVAWPNLIKDFLMFRSSRKI